MISRGKGRRMMFLSIQDFYDKANAAKRLSREQEMACAARARAGDAEARSMLIQSYLPVVASHVKRLGKEYHSLELVYRFIAVLERETDRFDFLQDGESFTHRLYLCLGQALVGYIADK